MKSEKLKKKQETKGKKSGEGWGENEAQEAE
jgi:hypothetical protein